MSEKTITWTRPMLNRLKVARDAALVRGDTQFTFDGGLYLVSYAKYLIEFLEGNLK